MGLSGIVSCSGTSSLWNNGEYEITDTKEEIILDEKTSAVSADEGKIKGEDAFIGDPNEMARIFNKRVPPLDSLLVCRDKQCAPAELSQGREYIYNALAHLIDNNLDTTALLCEANPQAHVCVNPYITVPAKVGVTPAYVYFDGVKLVDGSVVKGKTAINLVLDYNLSYNGQTPFVCKPDKSLLYVKNNNGIVLNGEGFRCDMTSMGATTIRVMFAIDYVDLDYGYIGGYYSIGLSGPAYGGGYGYGMIRLTKDGHPLAPSLKAPVDAPKKQTYSHSSVKPVVHAGAIKNDTKETQPEQAVVDVREKKFDAPAYVNNEAKQSENREDNSSQLSNTVENGKNNASAVNTVANPTAQSQTRATGNEPQYEEIYVDELDDYIK